MTTSEAPRFNASDFNDQVRADIADLHRQIAGHPLNERGHLSGNHGHIDQADFNKLFDDDGRVVVSSMVDDEYNPSGIRSTVHEYAEAKRGGVSQAMGEVPGHGFFDADHTLYQASPESREPRSLAKTTTPNAVYRSETILSGGKHQVVTVVERPGYTNAAGEGRVVIKNPKAASLVVSLAKKGVLQAIADAENISKK